MYIVLISPWKPINCTSVGVYSGLWRPRLLPAISATHLTAWRWLLTNLFLSVSWSSLLRTYSVMCCRTSCGVMVSPFLICSKHTQQIHSHSIRIKNQRLLLHYLPNTPCIIDHSENYYFQLLFKWPIFGDYSGWVPIGLSKKIAADFLQVGCPSCIQIWNQISTRNLKSCI